MPRAAVLGSPITHSRSPRLHLAAYRALGLTDWTYERIECSAERLPDLVAGLGSEWVGLSVTMPGKSAALAVAAERSARAGLVGSANTLVRTATGWRADCTDVDGVRDALIGAGVTDLAGAAAVVLGAGGTARPALLALAGLGAAQVSLVVREPARAASARALAARLGMAVEVAGFDGAGGFDPATVRAVCAAARVVVSTVPAGAAVPIAAAVGPTPTLLDAIYDPWPTPLASAVEAAGGRVVSGLEMLLAQAYGQVEQFTGRPAPRAAMRAALDSPALDPPG
ncbi:shikimate dehydrogenase [Skermania piniformis]|uniref:Shikimate dehydrogenase n=1 Tax=Skermania pinensis TaxID=39122 RepID=A0ABX8SC53_9ACTN|nr:shikimate dehydrogenase [Skermania piniformis]QXQ15449.1 shikimate dehydrogenase [Skermania piniformis]